MRNSFRGHVIAAYQTLHEVHSRSGKGRPNNELNENGSISEKPDLRVLVSFLPLFPLLRTLFPVDDEDMEECIEQKNNVVLNGYIVQRHRLRWSIEGIQHDRLVESGSRSC